MARTSLDILTRRVTDFFRKHASTYDLNPAAIEAHYILNWGGFVNASFTLTDGIHTYHLKLADDEDALAGLDTWRMFSELLSARFHAPRMLHWVKIPRTPFEGALFEYIPGQPADFAARPDLLQQVLDLLNRLHADSTLRNALAEYEEISTCTDFFLSVYINRFDEDLLIIVNDLPPFVSLNLLSWMMGETRELEGLARDLPAFQHPADAPTHGDLWLNNILVTPDRQFYVIDWDDLALGDPALDTSIVLGPLWRSGARSLEEIEPLLPADPDFRERFRLCLRAILLDEIIDTLADWVECAFAPGHQEEVRAAKERTHREALELYRELY